MKRTLVVVISMLVANVIAVGITVARSESAHAAGGGNVERCGGGEIFLNEKEHEIFVLHNEIRTKNDLPTFCVHPRLEEAARTHSKDMIRRDYFSYNTKRRGTFDERLVQFGYGAKGYSFYRVGENIALGSGPYGAPQNRLNA
jgi:uncharacterized protein YkwD